MTADRTTHHPERQGGNHHDQQLQKVCQHAPCLPAAFTEKCGSEGGLNSSQRWGNHYKMQSVSLAFLN